MKSIATATRAPRYLEHRWGARVEFDVPVRLHWSDGPASMDLAACVTRAGRDRVFG